MVINSSSGKPLKLVGFAIFFFLIQIVKERQNHVPNHSQVLVDPFLFLNKQAKIEMYWWEKAVQAKKKFIFCTGSRLWGAWQRLGLYLAVHSEFSSSQKKKKKLGSQVFACTTCTWNY